MVSLKDSLAEEARQMRLEEFDTLVRVEFPRLDSPSLSGISTGPQDAIRAWCEAERPGTLLLTGPVGSGKTHAGFAAIRELIADPIAWRFWPVEDLLTAMKPGNDPNAYEIACNVDVAFFDDLGTQYATEWADTRMYGIVNHRWLKMKRTIVSTNLVGVELRESLGERIYSRLLHDATIVVLAEADRRRTK